MAPNAIIYKVELQISDMDRHYYATHTLTLAQHPSETEERLVVRLLTFAMFADEYLEFGKGLSTDAEPDLWRKELTGEIGLWIELGQPDETRIRKACGRADQVVVVNYHGRAADVWWDKISGPLERQRNVSVIDIPAEQVEALTGLLSRTMRLTCIIQDHHVQLMDAEQSVEIEPQWRLKAGA
ncbi:MAG: YaeQ family protein [Dokdonella sp.]